MRTFSIDLASHEGHLACIDDDAVRSITIIGRVHETEVIPLLDEVLREAGWAKTAIERIACNLGPGGFTSVRNGVAFANALADGLGVPLAGYHGSHLALARCHVESAEPMWLHSTKVDALFALGGAWTVPTFVPLAEAVAAVTGKAVTGDMLPAHMEACSAAGATFPERKSLNGVLPAFLADLAYARTMLAPWYGRGI